MANSRLRTDERASRPGRTFELILAAVVVAAVVGGLAYPLLTRDSSGPEVAAVTPEQVELSRGVTAQPFAAARPCDVHVVPLDLSSVELAARLARALPRRVPVRACTTASFRLDLSAVDHRRGQLDAVSVADQLARSFQEVRGARPATILGVTAFDTYSSTFATDPYDFGAAKQFPSKQGFAVVSTARLGSDEARFRRVEAMALRYVGLLYFGLPQSSSPTSVLAPSLQTLEELDRLELRFASPQPSDAELAAARKEYLSRR